MACVLRDWLHEPKMCPVRPANCPCPNPDGSCPTTANCDRNNHIGHSITPGDDLDPESLDDTKWYDSVADQIPIDVVVPDLMTVTPENDQAPASDPLNVPLPASEVTQVVPEVDDGFMPSTAQEVIDAQNDE